MNITFISEEAKLQAHANQMQWLGFWKKFAFGFNNKSPMHLFADFYQRIDDAMKDACCICYGKEFGSFMVRRNKLEMKIGKFIPPETDILLNCRRELVHEVIKTEEDEDLFIENYLEKYPVDLHHFISH